MSEVFDCSDTQSFKSDASKRKAPLFVHPRNDYTGSTRVLATVIETEFPDQMARVICMDPDRKGFLSELPNVEIIRMPYFRIFGKPIRLLTREITSYYCRKEILKRAKEYDTIYLNTILSYIGVGAAQKAGLGIIWHIHEKFTVRTPGIRMAEKVFNETIAHRIFVSNYTKRAYPDNPACTCEVKYNSLSPSFLKKIDFITPEHRDRKGILMMASLSKAKGVDVFVEVARRMQNYRFTLILSSDEESIKQFFQGAKISSNCKILPAQSDIHPFLRANSLMLNLSNPFFWVETFGMTILEGMAYGIPAVVPNVGGPLELVQDGYNGHIVDSTNIDEIIIAIEDIIKEENRYHMYVSNSIRTYNKKFKV